MNRSFAFLSIFLWFLTYVIVKKNVHEFSFFTTIWGKTGLCGEGERKFKKCGLLNIALFILLKGYFNNDDVNTKWLLLYEDFIEFWSVRYFGLLVYNCCTLLRTQKSQNFVPDQSKPTETSSFFMKDSNKPRDKKFRTVYYNPLWLDYEEC